MAESSSIGCVGIFADPRKSGVISVAQRLAGMLSGVDVLWEDSLSKAAGFGDGVPVEELSNAQMVITLGGDGMMLTAARIFSRSKVPILGVNLGRLGFLTDLLPDELGRAIPNIINGDYRVEERMMFETIVPGIRDEPLLGLNEATIDKGGSPRILHLTVYVSGSLVSHIWADGIIAATPTGSTAYSMAAGGAILSPKMEAFIITSLAPYTLAIRPLIVGADDIIEIHYESKDDVNLPHLTVDGQISLTLYQQGAVIVRHAGHNARFVTYHRRSFYDVLRTNLGWGPPPYAR